MNEAFAVHLLPSTYMDLAYQLRKSGDLRSLNEIAALAIRGWLAARKGAPGGRGYQWKELFLPEGTELRLRYRGLCYYASIEGDNLVYEGQAFSPRDWAMTITGTVRNPWRDIWLRRGTGECWTHAAIWRGAYRYRPGLPSTDRRRRARRCTD